MPAVTLSCEGNRLSWNSKNVIEVIEVTNRSDNVTVGTVIRTVIFHTRTFGKHWKNSLPPWNSRTVKWIRKIHQRLLTVGRGKCMNLHPEGNYKSVRIFSMLVVLCHFDRRRRSKHHCSDRPQVSEEASSCYQLTPPVVKKFDWLVLNVTDRMYVKVYQIPLSTLCYGLFSCHEHGCNFAWKYLIPQKMLSIIFTGSDLCFRRV